LPEGRWTQSNHFNICLFFHDALQQPRITAESSTIISRIGLIEDIIYNIPPGEFGRNDFFVERFHHIFIRTRHNRLLDMAHIVFRRAKYNDWFIATRITRSFS